jgi:preprotein translocase subunit SecE
LRVRRLRVLRRRVDPVGERVLPISVGIMKKQNQKRKKSQGQGKQNPVDTDGTSARTREKGPENAGGPGKQKDVKARTRPKPPAKKAVDKKGGEGFSPARYANVTVQFLRESKLELKKVKWPTRKELLASTAVVIFLTLLVSLYLGIVDFGLIKIIRVIVG